MIIQLDYNQPAHYDLFLRIKSLPVYSFTGRTAEFPDEYASRIGVKQPKRKIANYAPLPALFDYQRDISRLAISKGKFSAFVEPGYGKTLIGAEFARHALSQIKKRECVLWVCPPMVVKQTVHEIKRFYGDALKPEIVKAADLPAWLDNGGRFGITNQNSIVDDLPSGRIGGMILDDVSLKNHYGAWGTRLIEMGRGVRWKTYLHGTPAPNDRIEYANCAVFMDRFPTVNSFLARYFVNRGQTGERWELKPHALKSFYRDLSSWSIFMSDPSVYGWQDNTQTIPTMVIEVLDVEMTPEQISAVQRETGDLYGHPGGITSRAKLARIAKGIGDGYTGGTNKPAFIRDLVAMWPDRSTIIWCKYNAEQDGMAEMFPGCANISGDTPDEKRETLIDEFKSGERKVMISKPKILGMGLNLQVCTRMVFSTCQDSYEEFVQALKRANRVGSTESLHAYLPVTNVERPMMQNVLRKAKMVEQDTREQEQLFKEQGYDFG